MEDELQPCPVCYREKFTLRKSKVCVSDVLSISCQNCKFTMEYAYWECLVEIWNQTSHYKTKGYIN